MRFMTNPTNRDEALTSAITRATGVSKLAAKLEISGAAVSQWRRVPATRVLDVEKITGVSRHDLRPDLYPRDEAA